MPDELLAMVVASSSLWDLRDRDGLKGFALCRASARRSDLRRTTTFDATKIATTLVKALLRRDAARDAYALPGIER